MPSCSRASPCRAAHASWQAAGLLLRLGHMQSPSAHTNERAISARKPCWCVQVAVPAEAARFPAAAEPHSAVLRLHVGKLLGRSSLPAAQPDGTLELSGLAVHLSEDVPVLPEQPWLLGCSETSEQVACACC